MKTDSTGHTSDAGIALAVERLTAMALEGKPVTKELLESEFPNLVDELRELLPTIQTMHAWGNSPAEPHAARGPEPSNDLPLGQPLGDFRIVRELGRGGMGVVYEAEQLSLRRRVAVKVLPFAALLDPVHLERFKNEARAAAMLKHPHIVSVYAVGCERSVHYYAMELIDGVSLADVIQCIAYPSMPDGERKPTTKLQTRPDAETQPIAQLSTQHSTDEAGFYRTIASMGIQAADAIQFAHDHGVVHRDLKPSNLILDQSGQVHITDFGLALVDSSSDLTLTGDVVGTLRYMSPEQLGQASSVDGRTDVYSLGATLYQVMCGRTPNDGNDRFELLRNISDREPVPIPKLRPQIPRDLATVVMKCLAKSPIDRYATAGELADDLRRFVENRPILAKKSPVWKNAWRWARRHKRLAVASGVAIGAVLLLAVGGPLAAILLQNSLRDEQQLSRSLHDQNYDMRIQHALQGIQSRNFQQAENVLQACPHDSRAFEWSYLWGQIQADKQRTIVNHWIHVTRIALNPDGKHLAMADWSGNVAIQDRDSRKQVASFPLASSQRAVPMALEFSPDGNYLFAAGESSAALWGLEQSRVIKSWKPKLAITSAVFSRNGDYIAIGQADSIFVEETRALQPAQIQVLTRDELLGETESITTLGRWLDTIGSPYTMVFTRDSGQLLVSSRAGKTIRSWDIPSFQERPPRTIDTGTVQAFDLHPATPTLAVSTSIGRNAGHTVSLLEIDTDTAPRPIYTSSARVGAVRFSASGKRLAIGSGDGHVVCWNTQSLLSSDQSEPVFQERAHATNVNDLEFARDDTTLISASNDNSLKELLCTNSEEGLTVAGPFAGGIEYLDEQRAVTWSYASDGTLLQLWRTSDWHESKSVDTGKVRVTDIAQLPSGNEVAYVGYSDAHRAMIGVWGLATGTHRVLYEVEEATSRDLIISIDRTKLIAGIGSQLVEIALGNDGIEPQKHEFSGDGFPIALHPQRDLIAIAQPKRVVLWSRRSTKEVASLPVDNKLWSLAFSSNGQLAAAAANGDILIWDHPDSNAQLRRCPGHAANAYYVRFSPDGRRLASAGLDGSIRLWNPATGNELLTVRTAASWNYRVVFSPSGQTLAHAGGIGTSVGRVHFLSSNREAASDP